MKHLSRRGRHEMKMLDDANEPYPRHPPSGWYNTHPRFTVWTDETLMGEQALNAGLIYGVYDHLTQDKHPHEEICTSHHQASVLAGKLNAELDDPFDF